MTIGRHKYIHYSVIQLAYIAINWLFPRHYFFAQSPAFNYLRPLILNCYVLLVKMDFHDRRVKNILEISGLLRYWLMLEIFGGKALEAEKLKYLIFF